MCLHKSHEANYTDSTEHKNANTHTHTHKGDKKSYLQNSINNIVVNGNMLRQKNCSWIY
jgi:hypothetical protein